MVMARTIGVAVKLNWPVSRGLKKKYFNTERLRAFFGGRSQRTVQRVGASYPLPLLVKNLSKFTVKICHLYQRFD
jgi:hypothetical protein